MLNNITLQLFAENELESENVSRETSEERTDENVSRETSEVNSVDYTEKFDNLNNALKQINANIRELASVEDSPVDTSINMGNEGAKKILVNAKNEKLSDFELYKRSLQLIDNDKSNGKVVQISPKFIEYMRQYVDNHEKGIMSDRDFKKSNIYEEFELSEVNL